MVANDGSGAAAEGSHRSRRDPATLPAYRHEETRRAIRLNSIYSMATKPSGKRKAVTAAEVKAALALEESLFGGDDGGAAVVGEPLAAGDEVRRPQRGAHPDIGNPTFPYLPC